MRAIDLTHAAAPQAFDQLVGTESLADQSRVDRFDVIERHELADGPVQHGFFAEAHCQQGVDFAFQFCVVSTGFIQVVPARVTLELARVKENRLDLLPALRSHGADPR
ncbi:MAG: hypothetical protein ACRET4_16665 [Steroidobacteraceae bacterium]